MRGRLALAVALAAWMSGCLSGMSGLGSDLDCSPDIEQRSQESEVLYPTPVEEAAGGNPRATVHARAGQQVVAQVIWTSTAGEAKPFYDGPEGNITLEQTSGHVWQLVATNVPAGNVTVGLDGDPLAFGTRVTFNLVASGCTAEGA